MSGYFKASLAAALVLMVNGVSTVEVLPVPLSQGQKIDGIVSLPPISSRDLLKPQAHLWPAEGTDQARSRHGSQHCLMPVF